MTRVFKVDAEDNIEFLVPTSDSGWDAIRTLGPARLGPRWSPIAVKLITGEKGRRYKRVDLPWFTCSVLVMRERARHAVGDALREHGELLPLSCAGATLHLFHCWTVLPALDESRSSIKYFPKGNIMRIERHVFVPQLVESALIFSLPKLRSGALYATERFVAMVEAAALTGLAFRPVGQDTSESLPVPETRAATPPRTPRASTSRTNRRKSAASHQATAMGTPLTAEEAREIEDWYQRGLWLLELDEARPTAQQVLAEVMDTVRESRRRWRTLGQDKREELAIALACLWAQTICSELSWEWERVPVGADGALGIVTPTRSMAMLPFALLQDALSRQREEPNLQLLYNMIKEGDLPSASPGEYLLLC